MKEVTDTDDQIVILWIKKNIYFQFGMLNVIQLVF